MRIPARALLVSLCACGLFAEIPGVELEPGSLHSATGAALTVGPRSAGTAFTDHVVLAAGSLEIAHFDGYPVHVRQLQVNAANPAAQARVKLRGDSVEIASLGGDLDVRQNGALLTRLTAGTHVSFQQSTGAHRPLYKQHTNHHIMYWIIGGIAVAALTIGLVAGAQGKSL